MKAATIRTLLAALVFALLPTSASANETGDSWSVSSLSALYRWAQAAPLEALPPFSTQSLDQARAKQEPTQIDEEATRLALQLARMHLLGVATEADRRGWNIADSDRDLPLETMLGHAVADGNLDTFFALMRPAHSDYAALRAAYQRETDIERRTTIARNMERWRWMPRSLGDEYVIVNIPRFEAHLRQKGEIADIWRVIVGKRSTPTPVFEATIEGVVLNPWWEIPASIVRESVGSLVRRNPALARARGYVWANGRYRQRPGPNNALGQMKLVMPNRFSIFMHDTPNKGLFDEEVRSFSHGCLRTDDAIGYAATLLEDTMTREQVDAVVASGKTTTIARSQPLPLYVTYFTAVDDGAGGIAMLDDIYKRDARVAAPSVATAGIGHAQPERHRELLLAAQYMAQPDPSQPSEGLSNIEC